MSCDFENLFLISQNLDFGGCFLFTERATHRRTVYQHTSLYAGKLRVCTLTVHLAQLAYKHRGASVPRPSVDAADTNAGSKIGTDANF